MDGIFIPMRALWITMTSLGVACVVLGVMSFVYGSWVLDGSQAYKFGAMRGSWGPASYAFAGTIAATFGAGLVTAGALGLRGERGREDRGPGSPGS